MSIINILWFRFYFDTIVSFFPLFSDFSHFARFMWDATMRRYTLQSASDKSQRSHFPLQCIAGH